MPSLARSLEAEAEADAEEAAAASTAAPVAAASANSVSEPAPASPAPASPAPGDSAELALPASPPAESTATSSAAAAAAAAAATNAADALARLDSVISGALTSIGDKYKELAPSPPSPRAADPAAAAPASRPAAAGAASAPATPSRIPRFVGQDRLRAEVQERARAEAENVPTVGRDGSADADADEGAGAALDLPDPAAEPIRRAPSPGWARSSHGVVNQYDEEDDYGGDGTTEEEEVAVAGALAAAAAARRMAHPTVQSLAAEVRERKAAARDAARTRVWAHALGELADDGAAAATAAAAAVLGPRSSSRPAPAAAASAARAPSSSGFDRLRAVATATEAELERVSGDLARPSAVEGLRAREAKRQGGRDAAAEEEEGGGDGYIAAHALLHESDGLERRSRAAQRRYTAWQAGRAKAAAAQKDGDDEEEEGEGGGMGASEAGAVAAVARSAPAGRIGALGADDAALLRAIGKVNLRTRSGDAFGTLEAEEDAADAAAVERRAAAAWARRRAPGGVEGSGGNGSLAGLISNLRVTILDPTNTPPDQATRSSPRKADGVGRATSPAVTGDAVSPPHRLPLMPDDLGLVMPPAPGPAFSAAGPVIPSYTVSATHVQPLLSLADAALAAADRLVVHQAESFAHDAIRSPAVAQPPRTPFTAAGATTTTSRTLLARLPSVVPAPVLRPMAFPPIDGTLTASSAASDATAGGAGDEEDSAAAAADSAAAAAEVSSPPRVIAEPASAPGVRLVIPLPAPPMQEPGATGVPRERPLRSLRAQARGDGAGLPSSPSRSSSSSSSSSSESVFAASLRGGGTTPARGPFVPSTPSGGPVLPFTPTAHVHGPLGLSATGMASILAASVLVPGSPRTGAAGSQQQAAAATSATPGRMASALSRILQPLGTTGALHAAGVGRGY
jgi:hypothetical protein